MPRPIKPAIVALFGLMLISCAAQAKKPLVDPFPLRYPLVEAGALDIDGHIVGQPWARDGVVYYITAEGSQTAVVVPSRSVLWRKPVEGMGLAAGGPSTASDMAGLRALKVDGSRLTATDREGRVLWEFAAEGPIGAAPAVRGDRVFFGTADRMFYCLRASTGRRIWSRRLQGAPLHPAVVGGSALAVAASNSVVYRLSAKGGSILSWEAVPSRIVYELAAAGPLVLVSSAAPTLTALDLRTGKKAGQYETPGIFVAGAVWASPYVVLFVEDRDSSRQRIVFLRSR